MPSLAPPALDLAAVIGERFQTRRLELGLSRAAVGERAAVSPETLRAFERTGQVSLRRLVRLAEVLALRGELEPLFATPPLRSLDDLTVRRRRQRGSRR